MNPSGLHRLADRVISKAKKLNVVMPVNASIFFLRQLPTPLQCVSCVLREYAQQNHIFFIRTVSEAWPSVPVLDILYQSGGPTRLTVIKRSLHVRMSSADPMVLIYK